MSTFPCVIAVSDINQQQMDPHIVGTLAACVAALDDGSMTPTDGRTFTASRSGSSITIYRSAHPAPGHGRECAITLSFEGLGRTFDIEFEVGEHNPWPPRVDTDEAMRQFDRLVRIAHACVSGLDDQRRFINPLRTRLGQIAMTMIDHPGQRIVDLCAPTPFQDVTTDHSTSGETEWTGTAENQWTDLPRVMAMHCDVNSLASTGFIGTILLEPYTVTVPVPDALERMKLISELPAPSYVPTRKGLPS